MRPADLVWYPAATICSTQKTGSSAERAHRERERPRPQPRFRARHAHGRHLEPALDLHSRRFPRLIGDERAEDRQAPLIDELAVGIDHRLRPTPWGGLFHLPEDDLDGAVDDA